MTNTPTPAEITLALACSSRENYKSVTLHVAPLFVVIASANPYKNGFGLHVCYGGHNYGVTGFIRLPSVKALAAAIDTCIAYGANLVAEQDKIDRQFNLPVSAYSAVRGPL